VLAELVVALVVEAPDGGVLDGAVHPLDLTICPGMPRLREPVPHRCENPASRKMS
jgi:hypothetical protein